jgi:2-polyprenyl-6-hydroxyphenyl methylase/3-demethylubiquinone-9 3-methyltransferase
MVGGYPHIPLHVGSAYDNLATTYGRFPIVLSLVVVEHLYDPKAFARVAFDLLEPNGALLLSTPYHGYCKNLVMAALNKFDRHHDPLWDHGHIKFWSRRTLTTLLMGAGFLQPEFILVGRHIPALAKSMIAVARKPAVLPLGTSSSSGSSSQSRTCSTRA